MYRTARWRAADNQNDGDDQLNDRRAILHGDIPPRPEPLPKFLTDQQAAKFMAAARAHHLPCYRLAAEILARTRPRATVVADEYASVCEQIDMLYAAAAAPGALPAEIETAAMTKLRTESHARMLGNGMCTRPVKLDCRMESACVDDYTDAIIEHAVESLTNLSGLPCRDDPGARPHTLASLAQQIQLTLSLTDAVIESRRHDYTADEIAELLGSAASRERDRQESP